MIQSYLMKFIELTKHFQIVGKLFVAIFSIGITAYDSLAVFVSVMAQMYHENIYCFFVASFAALREMISISVVFFFAFCAEKFKGASYQIW